MPALADIVLTADGGDAFIADCVCLAEGRIAALGGLRGSAAKAGLGMLKTAWPDLLTRAMRALAPDYLRALEPFYQDFSAGGGGSDFAAYLRRHAGAAAQALLAATEARAARVQNPAVKSVYGHLRGVTGREVDAVLPQFAELLSRRLRAGT